MTSRAALLASLLFLAVALFTRSAAPVYACSIGSFGTPERQLQALLASLDSSELVFVGTVVAERHIGRVGDLIRDGGNDVYVSDVQPEAVLRGESGAGPVPVRTIAFDDRFCEGVSRLREGEKVLLALDWSATERPLDGEEPNAWALHHFLGKLRIDETVAVSQYANQGMALGPPGDIVRAIGVALGTPPPQIEVAAIASTAPPLAVPSDRDPTWRIVAIVVIAIAIASVGAAVLRSQRAGGAMRD